MMIPRMLRSDTRLMKYHKNKSKAFILINRHEHFFFGGFACFYDFKREEIFNGLIIMQYFLWWWKFYYVK